MGGSATLNSPPPFLSKTYDMVDDPATDPIVSWTHCNSSFVVWNVPLFATDILPNFFKHNNFSSFVRQLNTYGFRKVDPERWEFANEGFLRGQKHLLKSISRRKPVHALTHQVQPTSQKSSTKACSEVGKFGLEEVVERLKRDKNVLMQELVRLRQQQQATDGQLQAVGQRVQVMEQRQQQMMSFLTKAMQNRSFLAQIVQQQNDSNKHITGTSKKRTLPNHEEEIAGMEGFHGTFSDGQIVKYQPLINEGAKSMLRQILKLNGPPADQSLKDHSAFFIDHVPTPSDVVDCGSCMNLSSAVTLCGVSQNSKQLCIPAETAVSNNHTTIADPKIHSSSVGNGSAEEGPTRQRDLHISQGDAMLSNYSQMQGSLPENSVKFLDMPFSGGHNSNLSFIDSLLAVQNATSPMEMDKCSPDVDLDVLLPGSNDAFWEQFFPKSLLFEVPEDVDSSTSENGIVKEHVLSQDEGWEKLHRMNHLTEQMDLLTAETERV